MRRFIAVILLIAVLAAGGSAIAAAAYQAGLSTAVTTTTAAGGTVVTPVVVPPYGYGYGYGFGWHPFGFASGIFGFLGTLLFLFIIFALIRAILFRGGPGRGGWGRSGWGGRGWYGHDHDPNDRSGRSPWEARAHETFDQWHQRAHDAPSASGAARPEAVPNEHLGRPDVAQRHGLTASLPLPRAPGPSSGGASRSTMRPMKTILVVDDEPKIATLARDYLEHAGFCGPHSGRWAIGPEHGPPASPGSRRTRPRPAGPRWSRRDPRAPPRFDDPDRDAHRARRRVRQAARSRTRRRRLSDQAV